jgi:xylulokinase
MGRAVMEGATYAMRDSLEIIKGLDVPVKEIRLSGGGARSEFWRQMQADIYGHKCVTINAEEGPAFGVALLAAAGTGAYNDVVEACTATIETVTETKPISKTKKTYNKHYPIYGDLYQSLKGDFGKIAKVVE